MTKKSDEIAVVLAEKEEVSIIKFEQFNNVNEQLDYAQMLVDSKLVPFKTAEQVVTTANLGKALGVPFEVAVQNMHNIQGKPTLSVHLITALAKSAGIDWELVKDCEKVTEEVKGADGEISVKVDLVTEIKFYRFNNKLNRVMENTVKYTWNDAKMAGYTSKDNWKTKPKEMMASRCLTRGLRLVGSDVLMGVFYEAGEMADAKNIDFELDNEGNVILK